MPASEPAFIRPRPVLVALSTCVSLALASLTPSPAAAAPASDGSDHDDAETIFRRGQAKYETADYNGAIELWTEAYALVDSTPENASIKALLIYNLAQAHVKAYELDEDPIHLKQAQQLLQSFRNNLSLLYEDQAQLDEETAKVDERLAEIDEMIAALEQPEPEPGPKPEPDEPPPPVVEPPGEAGPVDDGGRSGKPLIIAGGAALGLGAALGVVGIVGAVLGAGANDISDLAPTDLDAREQRFATGRTGNTLLIAGSIGAGVLLPTGVALIVVGVKRNKQQQREGAALLRHQVRLGASWGDAWGQGGALTISGRF